MPAATTLSQAKTERDVRLRQALQTYILKERQRKKEDHEAEIEEERLRKEREARERQHVMTLGETREQIVKLDQKLCELRNQKDQLCLQLKKVLNKQQQQKDSMQTHMMPIFLPPRHPPILHKVGTSIGSCNLPIKRGRSQSPPPHQSYYKSTAYSQPQKHDDGRRGAESARVLWNKCPTQYQNPGTLYYHTSTLQSHTQQDSRGARVSFIYQQPYNNGLNVPPLRSAYHMDMQQQATVQGHPSKNDQQQQKPAQVYHINLEQPPPTIVQAAGDPNQQVLSTTTQLNKNQITMEKVPDRGVYHNENKHDQPPPPQQQHGPPQPTHMSEGVVYSPILQGMPPMHQMQMQGNQNQNSKSGGSITQGYPNNRNPPPVHGQQQTQQMPGQPPQQIHYSRRIY